jgi:ribosomal protein S18 acetylase RimI-like enzyme
MTDVYQIRHAVADDMPAILGLIGEAAAWLQRDKNTDQWAKPWPDKRSRDARVAQGIKDGLTWIAEDNGTLAGTITCRERGSDSLWAPVELSEPAVYVSRLIVRRAQAGMGLGAALIDWAGQRGRLAWGANWIRIDVWTTNTALHHYYKSQGFVHIRTAEVEYEWEYPSAALFQKPTPDIDAAAAARFTETDSGLPEWPEFRRRLRL